jgi:Peptidase propeptide and YPEB domain
MMRSTPIVMILLLAMPPVFAFPVGSLSDPILTRTTLVASQEGREREPGPATLEEAIEIAVKRYGGRPAGAETVVRDGKRVHEIKVLNEENGSVRTVRIDPETGAIVPPRR